ncbi:MAG TPA: hypothetical protein VFQ63_01895 [Patescibacteria group bacterium]|nr:hypothetical protein [Patescibacteria group bacterium]
MLEKLFPILRLPFGLALTQVTFLPGAVQHLQLSRNSSMQPTEDPNVLRVPDGKHLGVRRIYPDGHTGPWVNIHDDNPRGALPGQSQIGVQSPEGHQHVGEVEKNGIWQGNVGDIGVIVEYLGRQES